MRHDDPRRPSIDTASGGTPRPVIDPGFTTSIPVVRPDTTGPSPRPERIRRTDNVFGRRLAALTLAVVIGAPIAAAIRPNDKDAEAQPTADTTLAVGAAATTATNAPFLLNPGGAQTTTGTVSLDGLPVLTKPGTAAAAAAKVAAEDACSGSYTVVSGDSWSYIADKVNVGTSELLAVNDANSSTLLLVGQQVCLPAGASAPTTNAPVTTKVPTTTRPPSTTTPPPTTYYSPAQVEQIIRDIWPDNLEDTAIAIARRESKLNPYAKNWCCYGLFQIYWDVHKSWLAAKGVTSSNQLFDPRINTKAALWVYQRSGSFAPWGM